MILNNKALTLSISVFWLLMLFTTNTAAAIPIEWEIQNRYRVFDYIELDGRAGPRESANILKQFLPTPDESLDSVEGLDSDEKDRRLERWFMRVSEMRSPFRESSGPWVEKDGTYRADFVDLPRKVFITARLGLGTEDAHSLRNRQCSWHVQGVERLVMPCDQPIEIESFDSAGAIVAVHEGATEIASQFIAPDLKIILGLGDSYGSGEGSPDQPTAWKNGKVEYWPPYHKDKVNDLLKSGAKWWSNRCDRSFYSYQNLVALHRAVQEKRSVVAFVHLACSGAEIIDGLLARQRLPPGALAEVCKVPKHRSDPDEFDPRCDVPYSQLHAAVKLLCRGALEPLTPKQISEIKAPLKNLRHGPTQRNWIRRDDLKSCREDWRDVDQILLSIGGNDIGFGGIIAATLLPERTRVRNIPIVGPLIAPAWEYFGVDLGHKKGGAVCVYTRADGKGCRTPKNINADIRLDEVHKRYKSLRLAMNYMMGKRAVPVVLNQYPNPLIGEKGKRCADVETENHIESMNNAWRVLFVKGIPEDFQINLLVGESVDIEARVIKKLNEKIAGVPHIDILDQSKTSDMLNWKIAPLQDVMMSHGWCTGENIQLIGFDRLSDWNPNIRHTRYVRTGNDSFLTQWPDKGRESGFNGTFHPNPQGYGAMAKEVLRVVDGLER